MTAKRSRGELRNRKAYYNYSISSTYEAGIVLFGWAVKAIREGQVDIKDAYVHLEGNPPQAFVHNFVVTPLSTADGFTKNVVGESSDSFKLLLNRSELRKLHALQQKQGVSFPVTRIYFKEGRLKVEFGVGEGKKNYDKRQSIKEAELKRRTRV